MTRTSMLLLLGVAVLCGHALATTNLRAGAANKKAGRFWGNMMYADGGPDVEYGQTRAEEKETFSEKEYASDDPNDDENGYKGDYNTVDTDRPDGEDAEEANEGAEHDGDVEPESFLQLKAKTKHAYKKKGWGNVMDAEEANE